jgi:hypothetical protein
VTGVQRYADNITRGPFAIRDGILLLAPLAPLRALDGIDIQQIGTVADTCGSRLKSPSSVGLDLTP